MDEATTGERLRTLRRWRGKTQAELAGLAGLSQSFVSMIENGQRPLDRRSDIAALASALKVSETDLVGGPHLSSDRQQSDPHLVVPALRMALMTNSLSEPAVERARPLPELVNEVSRIGALHLNCDRVTSGSLLPTVLDELHYHIAQPADEAALRLALGCLVEACFHATFEAKDLGYSDLAWAAANRADEAARMLDDPVQIGKAAFLRVHTQPRAGSWGRTLVTAERAASRLEPHANDEASIPVLGMLTLSAALSAAAVQDVGQTDHWLDVSAELAARVPDAPAENWQSFSKTNVGIWRVAIDVERGYGGGSVLKSAEGIQVGKLAHRKGRHATLLADVGRGLARDAQTRDEAVRYLRRAEDLAPQFIRNSRPVHETVSYLLNRSRANAGGRELRGIAARMGVQ
jgi:transcriptional regulator with XRE-family HTH domain